MGDIDRIREIRRWRDQPGVRAHYGASHTPGDSDLVCNNKAWWRDVDTLLREIDHLAPPRSLEQVREAETIVRDLADGPEPLDPEQGALCGLCDVVVDAARHAATCPYRRAREWVAAHPVDGGTK